MDVPRLERRRPRCWRQEAGELPVGREGGEFWVDYYVSRSVRRIPTPPTRGSTSSTSRRTMPSRPSYTYYGSPLKRALLKGVLTPASILDNTAVFPPPRKRSRSSSRTRSPPKGTHCEPDLDRVQERLGRRSAVARRRGRRVRGGGPRSRAGSPSPPPPGMRRSSSRHSASSPPTASRSSSGFAGVAFTWNLDNYRALWDPVLRRGVPAHALALPLRHRRRHSRSPFPFASGSPACEAQDAPAPARRRPILDELPDSHVRLVIILDPEFPIFPLALRRRTSLYTTRAVYIGVVYNYLPLMILPLYAALERHRLVARRGGPGPGRPTVARVPSHHAAALAPRHRGGLAPRLHPAHRRVPDPGDPRREQDLLHGLTDCPAVQRGA